MPSQPNQVRAGDSSKIPTAAGWLDLVVVIDLCSRPIVVWALADLLRASLVCDALRQALGSRSIAPDASRPLFHSDRGSQFGSAVFRQLFQARKLTPSLSARANPTHNAWTEFSMGTLRLQGGSFINALTEIFATLDAYTNTRRKHSSLADQTPFQFESNLSSNT